MEKLLTLDTNAPSDLVTRLATMGRGRAAKAGPAGLLDVTFTGTPYELAKLRDAIEAHGYRVIMPLEYRNR